MDWIDPAEDGDTWQEFVNMVTDLRFPKNAGNLLTSCGTVKLLKKDCSIEVVNIW